MCSHTLITYISQYILQLYSVNLIYVIILYILYNYKYISKSLYLFILIEK